MRGAFSLITALAALLSAAPAARAAHKRAETGPEKKSFSIDLVEPGKTQVSQLRALLGAPYRRVPESPKREYYFYSLGEGSTMDATVSVRSGVVEYVSYLCSDSISAVKSRFAGEASVTRTLSSSMSGYTGELTQLLYEGKGRGFIFEPRTYKVRACVSWEPGRKFDELGK